jgi:hypothetical protein
MAFWIAASGAPDTAAASCELQVVADIIHIHQDTNYGAVKQICNLCRCAITAGIVSPST